MAATPITAAQLSAACGCRIERASKWLVPINDAMAEFGIDTPARQAAFLAQVAHESARLATLEENLNYSAVALRGTFPKYFPSDMQAHQYARQPEKIANRVYAGRIGNGDEASGDGWSYKGRGLIQITGQANYAACGDALGVNLLAHPELLLQPRMAAFSAAWFWAHNRLNDYADKGDFVGLTKRINGGTNGLADRQALFKGASEALA